MRSGALLGFLLSVGSVLFSVACGSEGAVTSADAADSSLVGGAGGSVSLLVGGQGGGGSGGRASVGGYAGAGNSGGSTAGTGVGNQGGFAGTGGGKICPPASPDHEPTCAKSTASDACAACVCNVDSCADVWDECASDTGCSRALVCVLGACATSLCAQIAGSGQAKLVSLVGCLTGTCADACGVEMGQGGAAGAAGGSGAAGAAGIVGSAGNAGFSHGGGGGHNAGGAAGKSAGAGGANDTGGQAGSAGSGGDGVGGGGPGAGGVTSNGGAAGAQSAGGAGGTGPTLTCDGASCDHDLCANGDALGSACGACAYGVCAMDGYCCDSHGYWDDLCVARAASLCGCECNAAGGSGGSGGVSGAAGTGGSATIACVIPSETPSQGACATVNPNSAVECNPITGAPCDVASGAVCDTSFVGGQLAGYHCYGGVNTLSICGACGLSTGFCSVGLTCTTEGCAKFCCTQDDCGTAATCDLLGGGFGVGVCIAK